MTPTDLARVLSLYKLRSSSGPIKSIFGAARTAVMIPSPDSNGTVITAFAGINLLAKAKETMASAEFRLTHRTR